MYQVTPEEAKSHLLELIQAALRGETVLIAQDDEQQVQLVPVTQKKRGRKAGSAKGTMTIAADFDAPLADFVEYMQ